MADIEHDAIPDAERHEPKGASTATSGQFLKSTGSGATTFDWASGAPVAVLQDEKSSGTNGGSSTTGSWQTRDLNTEVRDDGGVISITSNEFTPTADGWVEWSCPFYRTDLTLTRLYNVTDGTVVEYGTSIYARDNADGDLVVSVGGGAVEASKDYRIEYRCTEAQTSDGLGRATSFGTEVYTRVLFWRT